MLLNAHIIEIDTLQPFIFFIARKFEKKIIVGTIVVSWRGAAAAAWNTERDFKKKISKQRRVRRIG